MIIWGDEPTAESIARAKQARYQERRVIRGAFWVRCPHCDEEAFGVTEDQALNEWAAHVVEAHHQWKES